jgi:chromosome segregation ATPase
MIIDLITFVIFSYAFFWILASIGNYFERKRDKEIIKLKTKLEEREDHYLHKLIGMDTDLNKYRDKYYNTIGDIESLEDQIYYLDMDIEHYVNENHELQYRIEELQFEIDNLKNGGY